MKKYIIWSMMVTSLSVAADIRQNIESIEPQMLEWRRDFHQHPELSNEEFRTSDIVTKHLESLNMNVKTKIAHTGVVGLLDSGKPGPLIALRADMDALPVTEQTDVPFASKVKAQYRGEEVGVMHACGHDTHVAMLMAAAEVLAHNKDEWQGKVMFIFQPAEEGTLGNDPAGAELMLQEGIFDKTKPEAIYGIHVTSSLPSGVIGFRTGPYMAAVDDFELVVKGLQTHGSRPWGGIDPIVTSAQIINSVQTIISRRTDITKAPAVVSFGAIKGGIRNNIIPDDVTMVGTIRNFDMDIRKDIHNQLNDIVHHIGQANQAKIEFKINHGYPVTINDPELGQRMLPTLNQVFGEQMVIDPGLITGAEDFSYFANETPGLYFFMGVTPIDQDYKTAASNHSPLFYVDESALIKGVEAFVSLVQNHN